MGATSDGASDSDELVIRPARPDDRDAVLAFCASIWDGDDYIPFVWNQWLNDETGFFLVAAAGGRPVGIVHLRMMGQEEAWLEGIRVDPTMRRQGIGRALVSRALVAGRERGAEVARLMTSSANTASQQLIARFGFSHVAEVAHYQAQGLTQEVITSQTVTHIRLEEAAETTRGPLLAIPGPEDFERIWAWLAQSNLRSFTGGLEMAGWGAQALSEPKLQHYLSAGSVLALEEWDSLQALAIAVPLQPGDDGSSILEVRYIDGMADGLGRLALALRVEAGERSCSTVELWLPTLLILHDAMQGAGYARLDEAPVEIYAREL